MAEFDRFASNYKSVLDRSVAIGGESSEYFTDFKAAYIDRFLGGRGGRKILDFGCGVGLLSSALGKLRPRDTLHGFDVSDESLEAVDPGLRERGLFTSKPEALHRDYDLIVLSNVMHHLPVPIRQATISDLALAPGPRRFGALVIEHNSRLQPRSHAGSEDSRTAIFPDDGRDPAAAGGSETWYFHSKSRTAVASLARLHPVLSARPVRALRGSGAIARVVVPQGLIRAVRKVSGLIRRAGTRRRRCTCRWIGAAVPRAGTSSRAETPADDNRARTHANAQIREIGFYATAFGHGH